MNTKKRLATDIRLLAQVKKIEREALSSVAKRPRVLMIIPARAMRYVAAAG